VEADPPLWQDADHPECGKDEGKSLLDTQNALKEVGPQVKRGGLSDR
jgi:hypothetical protein